MFSLLPRRFVMFLLVLVPFRLAHEFLLGDLQRSVAEFSESKKGVYKNAKLFCKAFNDLEGPEHITSVVVPYSGKLWACQMSFKEGPLIEKDSKVSLTFWGLYLLPMDWCPCQMPHRAGCQMVDVRCQPARRSQFFNRDVRWFWLMTGCQMILIDDRMSDGSDWWVLFEKKCVVAVVAHHLGPHWHCHRRSH